MLVRIHLKRALKEYIGCLYLRKYLKRKTKLKHLFLKYGDAYCSNEMNVL